MNGCYSRKKEKEKKKKKRRVKKRVRNEVYVSPLVLYIGTSYVVGAKTGIFKRRISWGKKGFFVCQFSLR